ncbi:helix-loop-helix protein 6-like [Centruroides sculpturatus]|uniref:helix-loop-helix protein 6-like n=1 Tax=Centruroides sculpturatus TaxID=218467 RepID=UPI000C6EF9CE|nr:helix-loop-helix protein 6-like [Centruroides sculpturatus]
MDNGDGSVEYASLLPLNSHSDSDSNFGLSSDPLSGFSDRFFAPVPPLEEGHFRLEDEDPDRPSKPNDPFAPQCKIPIPSGLDSCEYWLEPTFIRRRNERERQRVRNVNDGFERLKNHLPLEESERERRMSKVETLRLAIAYIRQLEDMLKENRPRSDNADG